MRESVLGLMDVALPAEELEIIQKVLNAYSQDQVRYHLLRTRQAGASRFVSFHVLVPGDWTVQHGHHLLEQIEADLHKELPNLTVFTHLESIEDPASWDDEPLYDAKASPNRPPGEGD